MAAGKPFRAGPLALTNVLTTDLLNPASASGGVNGGSSGQKIVITQVNIVNKTVGAVTCSFWLGATGGNVAGTEILGQGLSVAANERKQINCNMVLDTTDFLVGGASANASLTIELEGYVVVA